MLIWSRVVGFLVIGYLCMQKGFAYLGVPPLFIGEIALFAFMFLKPRLALGTWTTSLLRTSPLNALSLAMLVFVLYGAWQLVRGVMGGASILYAMKFFVFNYYPLYLFLGIWVGVQSPYFLPTLARAIAWAHGIYGLVWIVALQHISIYMPGSGVKVFGWPGGGAAAVIGLMCFGRDRQAFWTILAMNMMVTLFMQMRAQWLGLAAGLLVWGLLMRRLGKVAAIGAVVIAAFGLVELAGIELPGDRGKVSLAETLARAIAPIDPELAQRFAPEGERYSGSTEWRQKWWEQIWSSVHSTPMLEVSGHGYGFDLFSLAPAEVQAGQAEEIRTPHSVFYYALGYTGWVGVALFAVFQFTIFRLLWRSFQLTGQPAGVAWWVMGISMALFEESFDTPFKAIPFYLLMGLSIAPALRLWGESYARPARAQLLPVAGR
jgi:hypothetical protein